MIIIVVRIQEVKRSEEKRKAKVSKSCDDVDGGGGGEMNAARENHGKCRETNLGSRSSEEIVDLLVDIDSAGEILGSANLGFDKVIAVHRRRDRGRRHAGRHELEQGHLHEAEGISNEWEIRRGEADLSGGILAGDSLS